MNTPKQINLMILVVFLSVLSAAIYTLWDPDRASEAEDRQLEDLVERGAYLFSQNCAACHGDAGEGGAAANRLRLAPALTTWGKYAEAGYDEQAFAQDYRLIYYTIVCGRVGKVMPTWGQSQGGTLNEEQIRQLTMLILRGGDAGWEETRHFAFRGVPDFGHPGYDRNALSLAEPLAASSDTLVLNRTTGEPPAPGETPPQIVNPNERLQIGGDTGEGDVEIMLVLEVDTATNTVTVERGVGTTDALDHEAGVEVFQPIAPPAEPDVVQRSCGQIAGAAGPTPTPPPATDTMTIIAEGLAWNTPFLTGIANVPLTITVDNRDDATMHNWHLTLGAEPGGDEIPNGGEDQTATELAAGPSQQTLEFGPLAAGQYYYLCDVHPAMEGVLTVQEGTAGGDAAGDGGQDNSPGGGGTPVPGATGTPSP